MTLSQKGALRKSLNKLARVSRASSSYAANYLWDAHIEITDLCEERNAEHGPPRVMRSSPEKVVE